MTTLSDIIDGIQNSHMPDITLGAETEEEEVEIVEADSLDEEAFEDEEAS